MPLAAIAILSAGVLAFEVLLTRLFSIIQWHHFAYMAISIALLGYGASGTFLSFTRERLGRHFIAAFAGFAALFGVSAVASFAIAQRLPFNALELVWAPGQFGWLVVMYLLFTVPFFCAATCVGLAFTRLSDRIGKVYRADLTGAGVGALGVVAALFLLPAADGLRLVLGSGVAAAAVASLGGRGRARRWWSAGFAVAAIVLALALPASWIELRPSEFKGLSQMLRIPGAEVVATRSGPLGLIEVVQSDRMPLRHAPGLSLTSAIEPPRQFGVFVDGEGPSAITAFDGDLAPLSYLDDTSAAAPYQILNSPNVLVLGAGGGADILQALAHGAERIDAVELDAAMVRLMGGEYADFSGRLFAHPKVHVHIGEARAFVDGSPRRYDLIQVPLLDSLAAATVGTRGLSESYVYTVEAFDSYLAHLAPDGILAITRWLRLPPRGALKLFATATSALERAGVAEPGKALAMIRSWNTVTLLVKNGAFTETEIAELSSFAEQRSFDMVYAPGMRRSEANRFNILDAPYFYDGAHALLGPERDSFIARYKFDIAPSTDDRPYFFDFFRRRALPELIAMRAQGGAALLDWGTLIVTATLVQAAALSVLLILVPLWFRRTGRAPPRDRRRVATYFLLIGLAFLFVEIASIQRFVLFLGDPIYALAVVLGGFLVFAGLGSGTAPALAVRLQSLRGEVDANIGLVDRLLRPVRRLAALELAVLGIAATAMVYLVALPPLFRLLAPLGDPLKILVSLALIAPLAFWMGMPFPLALVRVSRALPAIVPWAWGINGCASVISAVLATLLATSLGFTAVMLIALGLYGLAALTMHAPLSATDTVSGSV